MPHLFAINEQAATVMLLFGNGIPQALLEHPRISTNVPDNCHVWVIDSKANILTVEEYAQVLKYIAQVQEMYKQGLLAENDFAYIRAESSNNFELTVWGNPEVFNLAGY